MQPAENLIEYGSRRVIVTLTCIVCALLEIIDTTIVNVSLNDMRGELGATLSEVGWVITAYAIANVIVVPMTSWLSAQFGRRNYFAASIMLFTVASFLCGQATGIWELVAFRFLQGLGGGALLVTSQTIMTESFPPEKRGMAQALYGMGVIVGPTLGPPLGGYITENFGWPLIFYINIPLGITAAMMALQYVRSPIYAAKKALSEVDWWGILFLAVAVGSLQYILERGQEDDWFESGTIVLLTVTAVLGFYAFIWRELTYHSPIVELRVLNNGNLRIGVIFSFILGFGLYGSTFIIPLYTQTILGWTPTQAGLLLMPASLITGATMPIVGRLMNSKIPKQAMIMFGMMMFAGFCFYGYTILTPNTGSENFYWMLVIRGLGMGFLFVPITAISLSTLKGQQIGQGAAFTGMMRQLGGSFGVAIITTFMARASVHHAAALSENLDVTNPTVASRIGAMQANFMQKGATAEAALQKAYAMLQGSVMRQASVLSYMDVFLYLAILFVLCVPVVLFIRDRKGAKLDPAAAAAAH